MKQVIGFEGAWPADSAATYGATAIQDGETIINGITGSAMPLTRLSEAVRDGQLTLLDKEGPTGPLPTWVVAFRRKPDFMLPLLTTPADVESDDNLYYFKSNLVDFELFREKIVNYVLNLLLLPNLLRAKDSRSEILAVALTFGPKNPYVHAVRVWHLGITEARISTSKSLLGVEAGIIFDEYLAGLTGWKAC